MAKTIEHVHWPDAPDLWMPYAPAIKVKGGTTVYLAGVTAAPVYHHHPHRPEEFDAMPRDMEGQARAALENLKRGLTAVGATRSFRSGRAQPGLGRIFRRHQARHHDGAGGAARHRPALSGRDQRGGGDRLIRLHSGDHGSANLTAKMIARITAAGLASPNLPAITLART
jgi:hypothetical protein